MGQGTESCGGWEVEYDPYDDDMSVGMGMWTQKCGTPISISKMSDNHIKRARRLCENLARSSSYTCEEDKWNEWVEMFDDTLYERMENPSLSIKEKSKPYKRKKKKKAPKGITIHDARYQPMKCACGSIYEAKTADLKRGWALSCSKSCAAKRRKYRLPAATNV